MNSIKGTPAYWKKLKSEVQAMIKQSGVPTFLLTFSSTDLRRDKLGEIIPKLNKVDCNISNLSYHDRSSILNSNPVIDERHFQYRVELYFLVLFTDKPLGKSKY